MIRAHLSSLRLRCTQITGAREWSNSAIRDFASALMDADTVCNVSGWKDSDKCGRRYRDYFPHAGSYTVTNFPDDLDKGLSSPSDIPLNLSMPLDHSLERKFDVVLNHTVLEHVRHPELAFQSICAMSKRYVITVVPFVQGFHFAPGNFGDYYRFTPMIIRLLHTQNGFEVMSERIGPRLGNSVYIATLGIRREFFVGSNAEVEPLDLLNENAGHRSWRETLEYLGAAGFLALTKRVRGWGQ